MKFLVKKVLRLSVAPLVLCFATAATATAAPVESVLGVRVSNPGVFLAALEMLNNSDATDGQHVTVWAAAFDGSSPSTHTVVVEYNSIEHYDRAIAKRDASPAWPRFGAMVGDASELLSTRMAVQLLVKGSGWREHGALVATAMSVSDPAAYAAAFARMTEAVDNPGSIRLMQMRFGGEGTTHVALFSGPNAAALNNSLDEMLASDAYARFARDVADIRQIRTTTMLRRVRTFGD